MQRRFIVFVAFLMTVKCETEMGKLAAACNGFAVNYYHQLVSNSSYGNFIISPFSLCVVLSMLRVGARNSTATQIDKLLGFKDESDSNEGITFEKAATAYRDILSSLKISSNDSTSLTIANAIFVQQNYSILDDFSKSMTENFDSDPHEVDFSSANSLETINNWASEETLGNVKQLLESIDQDTRVILANAVYFKGSWNTPFDIYNTHNETFKNFNGLQSPPIPTMHMLKKLDYLVDLETKARYLEIPYVGNMSMVLVLPEEGKSLSNVESLLTPESLSSALKLLTGKIMVNLTLPRFQLETAIEAKYDLIALGMSDAFTKLADLSGMTASECLKVSNVIQKATIEVNEEGSVATAASQVMNVGRSLQKEIQYHVNQPFIFFIRHKPTNVIIFAGKVLELP